MQGRRHDSSRREQARLPVIAPRYDGPPTGPESSTSRASIPLPETPRSRLPPRSRSGCWTCRLRKVKCDEQRPTCGQCSRLGHNCDYNPRLAFRDDTPRVIERMQEIRTTGSSVWDPDTKGVKYGPDRFQEDLLPAFATLKTDEEREKKAESKGPGTYLVVANPSSFASLPEYCEDESSTATVTPVTASFDTHLYIESSDGSRTVSPIEPEDPNIVILKTFEDSHPRTPFQLLPPIVPLHQTHIQYGGQPIEPPTAAYLSSNLEVPIISRIDEARHGGRDAQLLQHYRNTIAPTVILSGRLGVGEDPFERQARTFPPLFHAMMAVSALSLANRNNMHHADALEHYQQVIPAMRSTVQSSEDFASDGALFTHYLLLMYEIANSGNWQSNMWQHHCDRLFSIVTTRQQANGTEPYSYLTWMVALIDTYALLSGSGNGMFVEEIFKRDMVPPEGCLPPLATGQTDRFYREEMHYFPELLELNQNVVKLSVQIGGVARDLRAEAAHRTLGGPMALGAEHAYLMTRQAKVKSVHNACRELSNSWAATYPQFWPRYRGLDQLPYRAQGCLDHAQSLYMATVIYTYTCMYPSQIADREAEYDMDVPACATGIIEIGRQIVAEERWDCRYITFGLFIAGFASTNPVEKSLAFELFDRVEQHCYGGNTTLMKQFLSTIYSRQQEASQSGRGLEIDWIEEMRVRNMKLVMFGL